MNWYILTETNNLKERGKVTVQATGLYSSEFRYRDDLARYLYEPIPDDLKVPPFKLEYRAKLTDWILQVSFTPGKLISEKFLDCLNDFKAPPYKSFPTSVIDRKGSDYRYSMLM